ncbi:hypothetical protein SAMN04487764_2317 [Gillisia sp. Hel1_33_143]|uniref:hypothetical protein n=1 Tax=unclassified Gillisia TaxID=2615025 RepID=UPI00054FB2CB|nr:MULTISPECIES: hypothetical protein [unclassified Gillisia]SDS48183.1 hypothetical protein SAMN04487764_2317 [Gillisia sp. Hel1_33_143]
MKKNNSKYPPQSGFKIPETYFKQFEDKMLDILNDEDQNSIQGIEDPGFKIPTDYFATLENEVLGKTVLKERSSKVISIFSKHNLLKVAAIAAVFVGVINIWFTNPEPELSIDNVELAEIEDYIDTEMIDLNFLEISTLITQDGIVLDNLNTSKVNDEAVLEYLMNNVDDPDLLLK